MLMSRLVTIALTMLVLMAHALTWATVAHAQSAIVNLSDPVPGQAGVRYFDLAKLALPDLDPATRVSSPPRSLRHIVPDYAADPTPRNAVLGQVTALPVTSGGKPRLILVLDFGPDMAEADGYAIMAVYGFDGGARLLDMANVAMGHQSYFMFPSTLDVGGGQTAVVNSSYSQDDDSASNEIALILVRDDRLELIHDISILSHFTCAANFNQNPEFSTVPAGQPLADIRAVVTEELAPANAACGSETPPEAATRTIAVTYRWDASAGGYAPDSDAFETMREETLKRFP